jgi:hypothetical protein
VRLSGRGRVNIPLQSGRQLFAHSEKTAGAYGRGKITSLGGGQHRVCLVYGNAAARLPHIFRAEARTHFIYIFGGTIMKKKDIKFSTRMAAEDRTTIKELAKQANMSMSNYVTACCLGQQIVIIEGLKEVLKELKAIGNNLNQLVTLAHMGKITVVNLSEVRQLLADIRTTVREIAERKRW